MRALTYSTSVLTRMIAGIVSLFLLITCTNLAGLLLAHNARRRGEFAACMAIGASRWRLARSLLVESALLAGVGCAAGVPFAGYGARAVSGFMPARMPGLVLTTFDDDANLFGALRAGAAGYLLKDVASETLVVAIHAAARGESFLRSTVTGRVVAAFAKLMESGGPKPEALVLPLSRREREILMLLGTAATNKEVADKLNLAEGTVKNHFANILTKLDVRAHTHAAIRARQLGLL